MDAAQAQALIDALVALAPTAAPATGALITPYGGGELNLNSRHGQALFRDGKNVLPVVYCGKLTELDTWIA